MPFRPSAGSQCPMRHTIPKRERLFRRMQQLSQDEYDRRPETRADLPGST